MKEEGCNVIHKTQTSLRGNTFCQETNISIVFFEGKFICVLIESVFHCHRSLQSNENGKRVGVVVFFYIWLEMNRLFFLVGI